MRSPHMVTIGCCGLALLCCATPQAPAEASPADGKAANARGMELMGKKKWAEAAAEFKRAIAEAPGSVRAHYNLASAASRAHDLETAAWEIAWVGDRAAWDAEAKAASIKALNDDDLLWALREWGQDGAFWVGDSAAIQLIDLAQPGDANVTGHPLADAERAKLAAVLQAAPGAHDGKCDPADAKQGKVFAIALQMETLAKHTAVASLKDGVALVSPTGAVIARSEPLGCTGPGASQDQLASLVYAFGIPDALLIDTPHHPTPAAGLQLLAVTYTTGGRSDWQTNLRVFARRDKAFVPVFTALVASSDANGAGHVWQTPRGNLVYAAPGDAKRHAFGWDAAAARFVAVP
jgi:hypothetical protein